MTQARRRLAFALAFVLWGSLGLTCKDFVADPTTANVPALLRLEIVDTYPFVSTSYVAIVDIVIVVDEPVQAVDMGISWKGAAVKFASAIPHDDFDDDGTLFSAGVTGTKSLTGIVDLRHGAPIAQTTIRAARVALVIDDTGEQTELRASGEVAGPDGSLYDVVVSEYLQVDPPTL